MDSRATVIRKGFNNKNRRERRKIKKEVYEIAEVFEALKQRFQNVILTIDWDSPKMELMGIKDLPIFSKTNKYWVEYCRRWNLNKNKLIIADSRAFYDFAINQEVGEEEEIKPYKTVED